jgi:methyl-accepting chemotaxis protein
MDQTTQQNAALVEEMAAAASSLKSQASDLVQVVAAFKTDDGRQTASAPAVRVRAAPTKPLTLKKTAASKVALPKPAAHAAADESWESF